MKWQKPGTDEYLDLPDDSIVVGSGFAISDFETEFAKVDLYEIRKDEAERDLRAAMGTRKVLVEPSCSLVSSSMGMRYWEWVAVVEP